VLKISSPAGAHQSCFLGEFDILPVSITGITVELSLTLISCRGLKKTCWRQGLRLYSMVSYSQLKCTVVYQFRNI